MPCSDRHKSRWRSMYRCLGVRFDLLSLQYREPLVASCLLQRDLRNRSEGV
jgi:hypothetical protein